MANRQRGEVGVTVDGVEYRLRLIFDAFCQIEDLLDKPFDTIMADMTGGRMSGLRAMIWCVLQDSHSAEIRTLRDASNWIDRVGGPMKATELLNRVFDRNTEGDDKPADPPNAQDGGTGENSTSELAVPA